MTLRLFDGKDAADAFVAARIENVMAFEKWKAGKDFDAPVRKVDGDAEPVAVSDTRV